MFWKFQRRPSDSTHVVMLAQYLPLHFISTMQRLAAKVGKFTLVLSEPMDASRDWKPDYGGLSVIIQRSVGWTVTHRHPSGFHDQGKVIVPCSTIGDLSHLRPDVVIAVEVGPRTLLAFLMRKLGAQFRLIVQVRESEITAAGRGRWRRWLRRRLLPRVDGVFVNGASGRRHVLACGVDPSKITVVPSGTDTAVFGEELPLKNKSASDELVLLYVGQFIPRKAILPFAQALARVASVSSRPIRLVLAGRGPLEPDLRAIAWPPNVTTEFLGPVPYHRLPSVYRQADAFIMPTLADEWGLVVNEAMASGLPVLGSSGAQAVDELVADRETGWIYHPDSSEQRDAAVRQLLLTSFDQLQEMGRRAHRRAVEVSEEHAANAFFQGIQRCLRQPDSDEPTSALSKKALGRAAE